MKALFLTFILTAQAALAGDWPMWRYDSGRGSSSPHSLPQDLSLHWVRQLPAPMPAWPEEQDRLQFDEVAEPVVMGERIFVPSSRYDSVTAYSTRTGGELWRFYAEGPVRFAPVAHQGRVYFCSDDGCLYALEAEDGSLVWKVNGAGRERLILGNHRLISSWPARGGVVLHEGKLFFGASIWPFMGIYIQAVDPDTGATIWSNSGDGTNYTIQPHGAPSFASVVPQGHFAAVGQQLIVPGGRSVPGIYDTETGSQKVFAFDKRNGSHLSGAVGGLFFSADKAYLLKDGNPVDADADAPAIFDGEIMIAADNDAIIQQAPAVEFKEEVKVDRKGAKYREVTPRLRDLSRTKLDDDIPGTWRLRAGDRFYAGGSNRAAAYEKGNGKPVWEGGVEGEVRTMLAADDRLFVLTNAGLLHCFGPGKAAVVRHELEVKPLPSAADDWTRKAAEILTNEDSKRGYALAFGLGSGRLVEELLGQSELHVIVLEADPKKVDSYRRKMEQAGLYGSRTSILAVDPLAAPLPAYLCRLIVSEDPVAAGAGKPAFAERIFHSLRPYGGAACLELSEESRAALSVQAKTFPGAAVKSSGTFTLFTREGALPGTDDWTHQYANAAQTVVSGDAQVKAPFGVLWFGGPSHEGVLPRHGHGPSPQVAGGRLFIEGADMLRAVDVYTGQLLWEKEMPDFGKYYNTTAHFAGAGEIGSNYVSLPDRVYAVYGSSLLEIDSATGETLRDHQLPAEPGKDAPFWGHLSVSGDYLIATSSPVSVDLASAAPAPKSAADGMKEIIPPGAVWNYLAGQDPPDNWEEPEFEESADWKKGQAGFGYGDGDDTTLLDMQGKYTRVYIRSAFEAPEKVQRLALSVSYDDAFIAYLNGEEVLRAGIKEGRGAGVKSVGSHTASGFELMELKDWEKHLRPGRNVLAIEGHNTKITSSDFTLHPVLVMAGQSASAPANPVNDGIPAARYGSGSQRLAVIHRHTGKLLWQRDAEFDFRHNNIAVAGDRIFCIDRLTQEREAALTRRGLKFEGKPALYALDLQTGEVLWEQHEGVFGTFLNYSAEHDVVLQASSVYRDRAKDEAKAGMMALRGSDGKMLWHNPDITYGGPCLLWHRQILTNGLGGFSIDLLTGEKSGWTYDRKYGCNTAVGSEHLLTFRSGAAGFFDLNADSGTGNLGGFRSSCTNNLIPANGVLNAPDYTRTCTCSYQNQTSLALVHMPQEEYWTYGAKAKPGRIGINFGAPGDRRSEEGTLFVEYPSVGGTSDEPDIEVEGKAVSYRRRHSSTMSDPAWAWIGASVVESPGEITLELPDEAAKDLQCKVRLYFAEPDDLKAGERVFDVFLQGKPVLTKLDLVAKGTRRQTLIREFDAKAAGRKLTLTFPSKSGRGAVLSGIEVLYPSNSQTAFRP